MAKKQWFDLWVWKNGMEKPEMVARVKSEGLANYVRNNLADMYDFAGNKNFVETSRNLRKEKQNEK